MRRFLYKTRMKMPAYASHNLARKVRNDAHTRCPNGHSEMYKQHPSPNTSIAQKCIKKTAHSLIERYHFHFPPHRNITFAAIPSYSPFLYSFLYLYHSHTLDLSPPPSSHLLLPTSNLAHHHVPFPQAVCLTPAKAPLPECIALVYRS